MGVLRAYLGSARGRASLPAAVVVTAVAFTILGVGVTTQGGIDVGSVVLFGIAVAVAEAAFVVGARGVLADGQADFATLRALGWSSRRIRGRLLLSCAGLGILVALPALGLSWAAQALLGGGWLVGSHQVLVRLASVPESFGIVMTSAWAAVRRSTAEGGHRGQWPTSAPRASAPRAATRPRRGARRGPLRVADPVAVALKGVVIAGAGMALSLELAVHWAWQQHPVPSRVGVADWMGCALIVVLAIGTVGDLDWLAARDRAGESSTLRAMGWSARGLVWVAAVDAALFGITAGIVAGGLDVVGSLSVAGRMPHRMLAVIAVTVLAGVVISLLAAGSAALMRSCTAAAALRDGRLAKLRRRKPGTLGEIHCSPAVSPLVAYRRCQDG